MSTDDETPTTQKTARSYCPSLYVKHSPHREAVQIGLQSAASDPNEVNLRGIFGTVIGPAKLVVLTALNTRTAYVLVRCDTVYLLIMVYIQC
jgi:hypothetical protein